MRVLLLLAAVAMAGCATGRLDPHAPKTVIARAEGGSVTMKHGQRLLFPLTTEDSTFEWRPVEPPIVAVMAQGAPDENGYVFTPVRSGQEKLVFEYRPVSGEGTAQKSVSYDVTVR